MRRTTILVALAAALALAAPARANVPSSFYVQAAKAEARWYWTAWRGLPLLCAPERIRFTRYDFEGHRFDFNTLAESVDGGCRTRFNASGGGGGWPP